MDVIAPLAFDLDYLGQQSILNIYTGIGLFYNVPDHFDHAKLTEILGQGLKTLTKGFPWTAGQVVNEGATDNYSGSFLIKPWEEAPLLLVKDLRNDPSAPTMEKLRSAGFPASMVDENLFCPRNLFERLVQTARSKLAAVFGLQINLIAGGLVLCVVGHHQAMDMIGQAQVIRLLSKSCHGQQFTDEELSTGNLPRLNITPLLDESSFTEYQQMSFTDSLDPGTTAPDPSTPSKWADFALTSDSLRSLKTLATSSVTSGFVSFDDVITALLWQSVARARARRLKADLVVKVLRAVNTRPYLGIPKTYTGMLQTMAHTAAPMEELLQLPLGAVASRIRAAIDPETSRLEYKARAEMTHTSRMPDKRQANLTAGNVASQDLMLSSWAKIDLHDCDFDMGLGGPIAARRPLCPPVEGLGFFNPRSLDGEIVVTLCLSVEDMEILKRDEDFTKFAKLIG